MPLTLKEMREEVERLIPDDNLRHVLFNYDDQYDRSFLGDQSKYLKYFSNIMTFSALMIWNAFLMWKKSDSEQNAKPNNSFWRIYNMMDKACDPTKFKGDFVDDLMINLDIDKKSDPGVEVTSFLEALQLEKAFDFNNENFNSDRLSKTIFWVKQSRLSSRFSANEFDFDAFCDGMEMFQYLQNAKLTFLPMGIADNGAEQGNYMKVVLHVRKNRRDWRQIDFNHSVCVVQDWATYYMEDFVAHDPRRFTVSKNKKQSVELNYVQLGGVDSFKVILKNTHDDDDSGKLVIVSDAEVENFFLNCDIINSRANDHDGSFFRNYVLLNERYLKSLSCTVSDAISADTKRLVLNKYGKKYENVLKRMNVISLYKYKRDVSKYKWDEVILFLLLEEGVFEFLRFLLLKGKAEYEKFIRAFKIRCGDKNVDDILKKESFIANPLERVQPGASEDAKADSYARALIMLATKLFGRKEPTVEKSMYPLTIDNIIAECKKVFESRTCKSAEKKSYYVNTVSNTVRFVRSFYQAVFDYAPKMNEARWTLEADDNGYDNYIEAKKAAMSQTKWRELSNSPNNADAGNRLKAEFEKLITLNNKYSKHGPSNEILFDVLGRKCIFDSERMKEYGNELSNAFSSVHESSVRELYESVDSFLNYLKHGWDDNDVGDHSENFIEMAIYPIVGQYCSGVTSRDGYRYSYFKLLTCDKNEQDDDRQRLEIKIITDDEFNFGHSYYCVPNINRVADITRNADSNHYGNGYNKIWVSPIVIPCSRFWPQVISHFETLDKFEDFDATIELIYESDEYLYQMLFGSVETAKRVMPELLENASSKFYKGNYRIIRQEGVIVAAASLCGEDDIRSLNENDIRRAFENANEQIPPSFRDAISILRDTFDIYPGQYRVIDDICVHEEYRRRGIGRSLVTRLINEASREDRSVRLSVYKDNKIAYDLYWSLGFVPLSGGSTSGGEKPYVQMVKIVL